MQKTLTKSEFMAKVNHDINKKSICKDEALKYLQARGSEMNRRHAMHRKRSQR